MKARDATNRIRDVYVLLNEQTALSRLPFSWLLVFLEFAIKSPLVSADIELSCGVPGTTVQRTLHAIGEELEKQSPGSGLIESMSDPLHVARKFYFITRRGRDIIKQILVIL